MSMRTQASTKTSNSQFWKLTPPFHSFSGRKKIKSRIETGKDLERELAKLGYSEKAIQEISEWYQK
jgi:hypothetical protein